MSEDKVIVNGIELSIHDELKFINPENDNPHSNIFKSNSVWVKNIDNNCITVVGTCGTLKFNKHDIFKVFRKVHKFNRDKKWTSWIETKDGFSYKTDNTKYVRLRKDGYEVKSSCHPCDIFNLAKGVSICLQKIKDKKKVNQEKFENSKILYDSRFDILYIDFVKQPTFGYAEWIDKGVYLRKDSNTDAIIGIHIEDFMQNHIKR